MSSWSSQKNRMMRRIYKETIEKELTTEEMHYQHWRASMEHESKIYYLFMINGVVFCMAVGWFIARFI